MMAQAILSAATSASTEGQADVIHGRELFPFSINLGTHLDAGSVAQTGPPWRALLLAQRCEGFTRRPVRSCYADSKEPSHTAASHTSGASEILIANQELEMGLTDRKLSPLRISNRKYSRVLRSPRVYPKIRSVQVAPHNPFTLTSHSPRVAHHSPLTCPEEDHGRRRLTAFLIYGSAIKSRRKSFENSNLQIFNRR